MLLSNLLGPIKKPIFEILYRSALRAFIQMEQTGLELRPFANRFLKMARAENLKIEVVEKNRDLYLVEKIAWLIVITPEQDLQKVRAEFLERLLHTNEVIGTFVLVSSLPPRWAWAQVSEGKRMKEILIRVAENIISLRAVLGKIEPFVLEDGDQVDQALHLLLAIAQLYGVIEIGEIRL